ncbi:MAG: hypothetical protein JXA96_02275 [Sedimentisphaerales bacterium]|nr:hypothetical protein [Sedimentisphaerales bacterium]
MEAKNLLGIYLTRETATVVCLSSKSKGDNIPDCFTVKVTDSEQPKIQALASMIADGCSERKLQFSEVAVALDCSLFMQHSLHSDFSDPKQVASTVRFDTEEALAADISDIALTFEINSKDETGSSITVFTADKKILSEILLSLQQYGFDPITIKPDVNCLSKIIFQKIPAGESTEGVMFSMLSGHSGYLIKPRDLDGSGQNNSCVARTFLVGPKQNRTDLLAREITMTTALFSGDEKINSLKIFDSAGSVDFSSITEKTGILARNIEFFGEADTSAEESNNRVNRIDFAIAYGAAMSLTEKEQTVNFRDDFSPFQGKKIKTQKALKFAMVSLTMLLIAVGLYFHMNLYSVNRDIKKARTKFNKNYEIVMGKKLSKTASTNTILKNIGYELDKVKDENAGIITAGASVSSKLTLVLKAFITCAKETGLNVDTINISEKNIAITGDTTSRKETMKFFDQLRKTGLELKSTNYDSQERTKRDGFSITLEPTK